jgi:hypothetical protein
MSSFRAARAIVERQPIRRSLSDHPPSYKRSVPCTHISTIIMRLTLLFSAISLANALTVYNTNGVTSVQSAASTATPVYYGALAYNPIVLQPPPVPSPAPPTNFAIRLENGGDTGLSIKHNGAFFGLSIEVTAASPLSAYDILCCAPHLISYFTVGINGSVHHACQWHPDF